MSVCSFIAVPTVLRVQICSLGRALWESATAETKVFGSFFKKEPLPCCLTTARSPPEAAATMRISLPAILSAAALPAVPAEKGAARNLTQSPGEAGRDTAALPDGKKVAYLSDESGEYALHGFEKKKQKSFAFVVVEFSRRGAQENKGFLASFAA